MTEILKRVGLVVLTAVSGAVIGTIVALLFGVAKGLLGSGGTVSLAGASLVGIGWFGAIGALVGALVGKDMAKEEGKQPTRAANVVAWIAAVIVALLCLLVLFGS